MCLETTKSKSWLKKEEERLTTLYEYEIDTNNPDSDLNSITRLLSIICNTPLSLVKILDRQKVFVKSKNAKIYDDSFEREMSFCKWVIEQNEILEICNTLKDERFKDNPFSLCNPPVIYYAGMPLKTPSGFNIGVLCVIDHEERKMNEEQRLAMQTLARSVIMQFELNKYNKELKYPIKKRLNMHRPKMNFYVI